MQIDILEVKEFITDALKRAAAGEMYMTWPQVNQAYKILGDIEAEITIGVHVDTMVDLPDGRVVGIPVKEYKVVQDWLDRGKKIQAVKHLRTVSGVGLRDAKLAVEDPKNWDFTKYSEIIDEDLSGR